MSPISCSTGGLRADDLERRSWTPLQPATKGNPPDAMNALGVESAPLQRPGMPIEVAGAYVFLASPLGTYFTGEVIHGTGVGIPLDTFVLPG